MTRLYTRNSRGRHPLLPSGPRTSIAKEHIEDTYQASGSRKRKLNQRHAVTTPQVARRRKLNSPSSAISSMTESDVADDASDEDSQSDDDEDDDITPAVIAPSRSKAKIGMGRNLKKRRLDEVSFVDANKNDESMFGDYEDYYEEDEDPNMSPEENRKHFENRVFAESEDDENDDSYRAVDDISDSDDEDVEQMEEQQLLALLSDEEDDLEEANFYLNQIDGMSAYGFGVESDVSGQYPPSSGGGDSSNDIDLQRHVHFDVEANPPSVLLMSDSPTMSRALLPSALPDTLVLQSSQPYPERQPGSVPDESDDSDLTDDCLPDEAHHNTPNVLQHQHDEDENVTPIPSPLTKRSSKKATRRKGPPRGIFIDEGEKASGILDPSGKIILMTNPHLLGEDFARRYGTSPSSSPDLGFDELFDESEAGDSPTQRSIETLQNTTTDIMLASLNSVLSDPSYQGQATGPLEAFYPAPGFNVGDYTFEPDDLEGDYQADAELGEDVINLEDVIRFDEDSDDDSDSPTSPIFMPPNHELHGEGSVNYPFTHLTNTNVTAFRRSADPHIAAAINSSAASSFYDLSIFGSPPRTRSKRKSHTSPYHSPHYQGVTPVQRMRAPENTRASDSAMPPPKRRRIST